MKYSIKFTIESESDSEAQAWLNLYKKCMKIRPPSGVEDSIIDMAKLYHNFDVEGVKVSIVTAKDGVAYRNWSTNDGSEGVSDPDSEPPKR